MWGIPTTALWAFRLGPEKAKRLLFTGGSLTGAEAVAWGLATEAPPRAELDARTEALLERIARVPVSQLIAARDLPARIFPSTSIRMRPTGREAGTE